MCAGRSADEILQQHNDLSSLYRTPTTLVATEIIRPHSGSRVQDHEIIRPYSGPQIVDHEKYHVDGDINRYLNTTKDLNQERSDEHPASSSVKQMPDVTVVETLSSDVGEAKVLRSRRKRDVVSAVSSVKSVESRTGNSTFENRAELEKSNNSVNFSSSTEMPLSTSTTTRTSR